MVENFNDEEIANRLGRVIRQVRQEKSITLIQLGDACGISKSMVSKIEKGECRAISIVTLLKIAKSLGMNLCSLMARAEGVDEMNSNSPMGEMESRIISLIKRSDPNRHEIILNVIEGACR